MESMHISAHVDSCGRSFLSLKDALQQTPRFGEQVPPETIGDEFDRFKLWAGNIAAHRRGRRSLEYRLRDAAHLKDETQHLLADLQESLKGALSIVTGQRRPWDEFSDSDTDSSSASSYDEDLQGNTELKQLCASAKNAVTCLFRLAMAIRDPAPNNQHRSTITVDKSFFEEHDIHHVEAKFAGQGFLMTRLGKAISGRRQYLTYREEHHKKLSKNVEKIGFEEPKTEKTSNSTEATPMPPPLLLGDAPARSDAPVLHDNDDALSQTSYATSVNATIRAPALPKKAKDQEFYECPLCFMIVSIHTPVAWKQHVYRDLHPYCCTFEHCTTADRLYDSRHAWFTHELEAHRISWHCIEGCGQSFSGEDEFEAHVSAGHKELASENMLSALKRTSARTIDLMKRTTCSLCGKIMTLRALQKHLGEHQEQLALFALPPGLDAIEDEPNDDGNDDVDSVELNVDRWEHEEIASEHSDDGDPEAFAQSTFESVAATATRHIMCRNCDNECFNHEGQVLRDCLYCNTTCHVHCLNMLSESPYNAEFCIKCVQHFEKEYSELPWEEGYKVRLPQSERACSRCNEIYSPGSLDYPRPSSVEDFVKLYRQHIIASESHAREWQKKHIDCTAAEPSDNEEELDEEDMDSVREAWKSVKAQRESKEEEKMLEQARRRMEEEEEESRLRAQEFKDAQEELRLKSQSADTETTITDADATGDAIARLMILNKKYQTDFEDRCLDFMTDCPKDPIDRKGLCMIICQGLKSQISSKLDAIDTTGSREAETLKLRIKMTIANVIQGMEELVPKEEGIDTDRLSRSADLPLLALISEYKSIVTKRLMKFKDHYYHNHGERRKECLELTEDLVQFRQEVVTYDPEGDEENVQRRNSLLDRLQRDLDFLAKTDEDARAEDIRFTDATGRRFDLSWDICKTWKGMGEMIKQAFLYGPEPFMPHVHAEHYDLVGPDGMVISAQDWETTIRPRCSITMRMWPDLGLPDLQSISLESVLASRAASELIENLASKFELDFSARIEMFINSRVTDEDTYRYAYENLRQDLERQVTIPLADIDPGGNEVVSAQKEALLEQVRSALWQIDTAIAVAERIRKQLDEDRTPNDPEEQKNNVLFGNIEVVDAATDTPAMSQLKIMRSIYGNEFEQRVSNFLNSRPPSISSAESTHSTLSNGIKLQLLEPAAAIDTIGDRIATESKKMFIRKLNDAVLKSLDDFLSLLRQDDQQKKSLDQTPDGSKKEVSYNMESQHEADTEATKDTGIGLMNNPSNLLITYKDCFGRMFSFPWEICMTWSGMESLIRHCIPDLSDNHDVTKEDIDDIEKGNYSLYINNEKNPMPKSIEGWTARIKPGCIITMSILHKNDLRPIHFTEDGARHHSPAEDQGGPQNTEETSASPHDFAQGKTPIQIQDLLRRILTIPWNVAKSWENTEQLIQQSCRGLSGPLVPKMRESLYEFIGPDGPIPFSEWDHKIQPGWRISMEMPDSPITHDSLPNSEVVPHPPLDSTPSATEEGDVQTDAEINVFERTRGRSVSPPFMAATPSDQSDTDNVAEPKNTIHGAADNEDNHQSQSSTSRGAQPFKLSVAGVPADVLMEVLGSDGRGIDEFGKALEVEISFLDDPDPLISEHSVTMVGSFEGTRKALAIMNKRIQTRKEQLETDRLTKAYEWHDNDWDSDPELFTASGAGTSGDMDPSDNNNEKSAALPRPPGRGHNSETLVQKAGEGGILAVTELVNSGVKPTLASGIAAARHGHYDVLSLLLASGLEADPPNGNNAMIAAIGRGHLKIIELLLEQKFDPTRRDFEGRTYFEISQSRQGPYWETEYQILKAAYDAFQDRKAAGALKAFNAVESNRKMAKEEGLKGMLHAHEGQESETRNRILVKASSVEPTAQTNKIQEENAGQMFQLKDQSIDSGAETAFSKRVQESGREIDIYCERIKLMRVATVGSQTVHPPLTCPAGQGEETLKEEADFLVRAIERLERERENDLDEKFLAEASTAEAKRTKKNAIDEDVADKAVRIRLSEIRSSKVRKSYPEVETLRSYEILYKEDKADPDYFLILDTLNMEELEILFEHTRRLRERGGSWHSPSEKPTSFWQGENDKIYEGQRLGIMSEVTGEYRRKRHDDDDAEPATTTIAESTKASDSSHAKNEDNGTVVAVDAGRKGGRRSADGRSRIKGIKEILF